MKRASYKDHAPSNSKNLLQSILHGIDVLALPLSPVAITVWVLAVAIFLNRVLAW